MTLNSNTNRDLNSNNQNNNNNNNLFYYNYPYTNTHYKNNHNNYYNNNNTNSNYNQYHGFKRTENPNYYNNNLNNNLNSQSEASSEENLNNNNFNNQGQNNQNYSNTNSNNQNGNYYGPKKFHGGSGKGGYYKRPNYYSGHSNSNSSYNNSYYGGYAKKKKPFVYNLRWDGYDPFTVKSLIYRAEIYIMSKYPNLAQVNANSEGLPQQITENSKFFVIKSFNEEDVHKAIKYSLWSSTKAGNKTLNEAFLKTKEQGGNVYLFFSCNGSGRYIGVARMLSEVNETKEFNYWTQDSKWQGLFDVEWVFIKDIPFKSFKMINIMMK